MPAMTMPLLHHLSGTASEQQLAALGSVHETCSEVGLEETVTRSLPRVVQSFSSLDEAVMGPLRASPPDNF